MSIPVPVQAALTAALVTLLIEYGAKPRLEARKDRVVRSSQLYQDLLVGLQMLRFGTYELIPMVDRGRHAELAEGAATLQHQAKELVEKTRRLQGSLERIRWMEVMAGLSIAHCCLGCLSDMTQTTTDADKASDALHYELGEIDEQLQNSLLALGRRSRKRWRVVRRWCASISGWRKRYVSTEHHAA